MNIKAEKPLVSAVITTHDRRELAEKAINSVLNQTYSNIELIVVDDKSTQENSKYIRSIADRETFQYIYIPQEESKGGNYARNIGINNSNGKYVAFLDDDDEWMPKKIECQVKYLEEHADYGVVSCLRIKEFNYKKRVEETDKYKIEGDIHNKIFTSIPYLTSTLMIRKDILMEIGCFDEDIRYWQEYDLAIRYAQRTKTAFIHEPLCLYRIIYKDKSRLTNNLKGWEESVRYIDQKYSDLIASLPEELKKGHQLLIARDGMTRSQNSGDRKQALTYGLEIIRLRPSIKNVVKLLLIFIGVKW